MSPVYATPDDLTGYVTPVPANATALLTRASRIVRQATLTAVYAVDEAGLPTDDDIAAAMTAATCEQVVYGLEAGDKTGTGAAAGYRRVRLGSAELERVAAGASGSGSGDGQTLAPQAALALADAGLLGGEPLSC